MTGKTLWPYENIGSGGGIEDDLQIDRRCIHVEWLGAAHFQSMSCNKQYCKYSLHGVLRSCCGGHSKDRAQDLTFIGFFSSKLFWKVTGGPVFRSLKVHSIVLRAMTFYSSPHLLLH